MNLKLFPYFKLLCFVLLLSTLVLLQYSHFSRYPFDESGSVIRSAIGQLQSDPSTYLFDVVNSKNRILWFRGIHKIYSTFPNLEPGLYNFIFGLLASAFALTGLSALFKKGGASQLGSLNLGLFVLLFSPFSYLSYGYHFKIAQGGTSTGLIAFGIMTCILGLAAPSNKTTNRSQGFQFYKLLPAFIFLFAVHPLNALFCLGLLFTAWWWAGAGFRQLALLSITGIFFAIIAMKFYSIPLESGQEQILLNLIHLINGEGQVSGYFIPWKNFKTLAQESAFWIGLLILLRTSKLEGWFSTKMNKYFWGIFIATLSMGLLHRVIYSLDNARLLATDPSRVLALLRPIGAVLLIQGLIVGLRTTSPRFAVQFVSFLSFPMIKTTLFPAFTLLWSRFRSGFIFNLTAAALAAYTLYSMRDLNTHSLLYFGRLGFVLVIAFYLIRKVLPNRIFFILSACLAVSSFLMLEAYPKIASALAKVKSRPIIDAHYDDLVDYLNQNVPKNGVLVTSIERLLLGSEIRPTIAGFHSTAYGIYFGNLNKISNEVRLAWGVDITNTQQIINLNREWSNRGGYSSYLDFKIQELTPEHLRNLKKNFLNLSALVVPKQQRLIHENDFQNSKDMKLSFQNESFRVYLIR